VQEEKMGEIINTIAAFLGNIISYIYLVVPNFGLAIIILTLFIKLVTFPLNNKQMESARKMQKLQPELKKIQQKYKDDKEKQNKAVSEFMQENKMNPLAGCMPLLVQFPVLIAIFRLLSDATGFGVTEIPDFSAYLIPGVQLWGNLLIADPYYIFPIMSGVTTFISQKQTMTDPNQKMLLYMMPVMITFLSFSFPAGLVLYWTTNNLFSMGQHSLMTYLGKRKAEKTEKNIALEKDNVNEEKKEVKQTKTDVKKMKKGPGKGGRRE
jgi:YidC/Oxa1 family membrane protein insertase